MSLEPFPYEIEFKRWESDEFAGFTAISRCAFNDRDALLGPPDQYALLEHFRQLMVAELTREGMPDQWGWRRHPQVGRDSDFESDTQFFIFTARGFYSKGKVDDPEESVQLVSVQVDGDVVVMGHGPADLEVKGYPV